MPKRYWVFFALWLALLVGAAIYAPQLPGALKGGVTTSPKAESVQAGRLLFDRVLGGQQHDLVIAIQADRPIGALLPQVVALADAVQGVRGVSQVRSYADLEDETLIGRDGQSTMILVAAHVDDADAQDRLVPELRQLIQEHPIEGAQVHLTGWAAVQGDLFREAMEAVARSERFVIPAVLVVLLLIFGSLVASLVPLAIGLVSVAVTMGLMYFYAQVAVIDTTVPAVISMLGMGVGVDYSLLLVSRFREELRAGRQGWAAVDQTLKTAGRAILFSGAAVVVSVSSLSIIDSSIFRSLTIGMALVVVISVFAALTMAPVILYLMGPRINALSLPRFAKPKAHNGWYRLAHAIMRRPVLFGALAVLPILLAVPPVKEMVTGSPDVSLLTAEADSRKGFEILKNNFDAGVMEPIDLVIEVNEGTVADRASLLLLYQLVQELEQDPAVARVVSHVSLQPDWSLADYEALYIESAQELLTLPASLIEKGGQVPELIAGLKEMRQGLGELRAGLPLLAGGLEAGGSGLAQSAAGLQQIEAGLTEMAAGFESAAEQVDQLAQALGLQRNLLNSALVDLQAMGPEAQADPRYAGILQGVAAAKAIADGGSGGVPLQVAVGQMAAGYREAAEGLRQLAGGVQATAGGLMAIQTGLGGEGAAALGAAEQGLAQVVAGLDEMIAQLEAEVAQLAALEGLEQVDLNVAFGQGDLGLKLVMAGSPAAAEVLPTLVNVNHGADVARIMVIPKEGADTLTTKGLIERLRGEVAPRYAGEFKQFLVGGVAAGLYDFNKQITDAIPLVIGLVLVITFVVLLLLLRSIVLPLKAILMNALSVLAAYGILVLVFEKGWLSGPLGFTPLGYVSSPSIVLLFAVLFGLSMDYEVFLLTRVQEVYLQTGDNEEACAVGLEKTAGIITGSAAIMLVVFGTFVVNGMISIKEIGVGLFVAILLDATLIRILMVPAFMRLMGEWNWWAPRWLLRLLPDLKL